jgi:MFS transporter, DHA2 family, methylenomycin A resistance protein
MAPLTIGAARVLGLVAEGSQTTYWVLVAPMTAAGLGMSLSMPTVTAAVVGSAPGGTRGVASGVSNTARQMGGVIGVALLGTLVAHRAGFTATLRISMLVAVGSFTVACFTAFSQVKSEPRILPDYLAQIRTSGYLRRSDDRFWWQ